MSAPVLKIIPMNLVAALRVLLCAAVLTAPAHAAAPFLEKVDLFTANQDGYKLYRIPGVIVTKRGTAWQPTQVKRMTERAALS